MFDVRVNGETVHEETAQVIGVSIQSARGEHYNIGVSDLGAIDIVLNTVNAGDPVRLDQLEAEQRRADSARREGHVTGNNSTAPGDRTRNVTQAVQNDTLHDGGPSEELAQQGRNLPPSRDLAEGLDKSDSATLTARIEAFTEHGDADKAIGDNKPNSGSSVPPPETTPEGNREVVASTRDTEGVQSSSGTPETSEVGGESQSDFNLSEENDGVGAGEPAEEVNE